MISIEQIKAARGLLGWTQADLALAAKLSKPAVNNIERKTAEPRVGSLKRMKSAFEAAGIEFIEGGVRFLSEPLNVRVLEGASAAERVLRDVEMTLSSGGLHLLSCVDERRFVEKVGAQKMAAILARHQSLGISDRVLVKEGDDYFIAPTENYRWVSEDIFLQVPYMVYGDKYAIILWEPALKVVVIESPQIAESYRQQFWVTWHNAKVPSLS